MAWVFLILDLPAFADTDGLSPKELATSLANSYRQWRSNVAVNATYTVRYGTAASKEMAFAGQFESVTATGKGVFVQLKPNKRISVDFTGYTTATAAIEADGTRKPATLNNKGQIVVKPGDGVGVMWASWDEVSNETLRLEYSPAWRNTNDRAVISLIDDKTAEVPGDCLKWDQQISPLNPLRGCGQIPNTGAAIRNDPEFSSSTDSGLLTVSIKSYRDSSRGRLTHLDTTAWDTAHALPLLVRWQRQTIAEDEVLMDLETRLSNFRPCAADRVAARIVFTNTSRSGSVNAIEWVSEDLGQREPRPEDFVIRIPATTIVRGLKEPPLPGAERSLNLAMYHEGDTLKSGTVINQGQAVADKEGTAQRRLRIVFLLNLLAGVICASYLAVRACLKFRRS